jgi:pSer/pThr/pTyr-binding forkhead associated (FHA) protein
MKKIYVLKHFEQPNEPGIYARLVCLNGKAKGTAYFISGEDRVVMGRSDKADITVLDIKSSREHAEIVRVENGFIVTDLGSQNGIYINDAQKTQHPLKNNDRLAIGTTVYKFNLVQVKEDSLVRSSDVVVKKNNKMPLIIGGIVLLLVVLFMGDSGNQTVKNKKATSNYKTTEIAPTFGAQLKVERKVDNKNKEKMQQYFQRGLREYREGNYFRALSEFNTALSWDRNDPLAQFYLRKTKDALDSMISEYFLKAKRNEDALKFQYAIVNYCAIVRLLYNYREDPRYKDAKEGVKKLEEKLGYEEGEIKCLNVDLGGDDKDAD